jgi:hypothetical protein
VTQAFNEQAETREMLLGLIISVKDACDCVTQVRRFKTSAQLGDRLKQLQPLVQDVLDFASNYQSTVGGTGASPFVRTYTGAETRW